MHVMCVYVCVCVCACACDKQERLATDSLLNEHLVFQFFGALHQLGLFRLGKMKQPVAHEQL